MSGCAGNGEHWVSLPLPGQLGKLEAAHAAEDGPAALVPCIDYQVSWHAPVVAHAADRAALPPPPVVGAVVSLPDDGGPPFDVFGAQGEWLGERGDIRAALELLGEQLSACCRYSAQHGLDGVPATLALYCGPAVGQIPACATCAALYGRLAETAARRRGL